MRKQSFCMSQKDCPTITSDIVGKIVVDSSFDSDLISVPLSLFILSSTVVKTFIEFGILTRNHFYPFFISPWQNRRQIHIPNRSKVIRQNLWWNVKKNFPRNRRLFSSGESIGGKGTFSLVKLEKLTFFIKFSCVKAKKKSLKIKNFPFFGISAAKIMLWIRPFTLYPKSKCFKPLFL